MECYICHELVKRNEYTRHVGSHLAGNDTGHRPQPAVPLAAFSYDTVHYDPHDQDHPPFSAIPNDQHHLDEPRNFRSQRDPSDSHREGHSVSTRSPFQTAAVHDQLPRQGRPFTQPNAFRLWLQNHADDFPGYTTIDGQKSNSDSQLNVHRQAAEHLRDATRTEVIKIVNAFEGLPDSDKKTCLKLVQDVPIFPGLVAYTYTHLVMCPRRGWFSSDDWSGRAFDLEEQVKHWTQDGDIQCILSCDTIKKKLVELLCKTSINPKEHKCNPALLNGAVVLSSDILNLTSLVALCITGPRKNDILDQQGAAVEKLVELLHDLLEANVELEGWEWYRRWLLDALIMFSKGSGCCPRRIYLTEVAIDRLIPKSQGGFGYVYQGKINSRLVAVKVIKRDDHVPLPEYKKQLSKEAVVWRYLRHPSCLPLYGIYEMPTEGPDISFALISPWMGKENLFKYLQSHPEANRTRLILDVIRGLDYLHSMEPHIAHRDIKPDNILITKNGRACLADFGLASAFDTDDHFQTATDQVVMGGTYSYMAPEIFNATTKEAKRSVNKRACDMYALGCTIYAAYTGRHPFQGMHAGLVRCRVTDNRRPEFPEGKISLDMWSFVENLWGSDPSERLTARTALGWMTVKARDEGMDPNPPPLEEEWEWKAPLDDKCLWHVSV